MMFIIFEEEDIITLLNLTVNSTRYQTTLYYLINFILESNQSTQKKCSQINQILNSLNKHLTSDKLLNLLKVKNDFKEEKFKEPVLTKNHIHDNNLTNTATIKNPESTMEVQS